MEKQYEKTSRFYTVKFIIYAIFYVVPMFIYFINT